MVILYRQGYTVSPRLYGQSTVLPRLYCIAKVIWSKHSIAKGRAHMFFIDVSDIDTLTYGTYEHYLLLNGSLAIQTFKCNAF